MTGGEIAALVAAGAFAMLALVLAWLLLRLGRTVDSATRAIRDLNDRTAPILVKADETMDHLNTMLTQAEQSLDAVNLQLHKVDTITSHAQNVTVSVSQLVSVVTAAAANQLVKAVAFGYGVRRAAARRAGQLDEREGRQLGRATRRRRRRGRQGA